MRDGRRTERARRIVGAEAHLRHDVESLGRTDAEAGPESPRRGWGRATREGVAPRPGFDEEVAGGGGDVGEGAVRDLINRDAFAARSPGQVDVAERQVGVPRTGIAGDVDGVGARTDRTGDVADG